MVVRAFGPVSKAIPTPHPPNILKPLERLACTRFNTSSSAISIGFGSEEGSLSFVRVSMGGVSSAGVRVWLASVRARPPLRAFARPALGYISRPRHGHARAIPATAGEPIAVHHLREFRRHTRGRGRGDRLRFGEKLGIRSGRTARRMPRAFGDLSRSLRIRRHASRRLARGVSLAMRR